MAGMALAEAQCDADSLDVAQRLLARQFGMQGLLRAAENGAVLSSELAGDNH